MSRLSVFLKIFGWPIAVLALHVLATVSGAYWYLPKMDNLMHFLGGASVAATYLTSFLPGMVKKQKLNGWERKLIFLVRVVAHVALAALLWEFMEFGIDSIFGINMQPDVTDTMSDMALGLLGGTIIVGIQILRLKKSNPLVS